MMTEVVESPNSGFIDWNDAFENGAYIPGAAVLPEQWAERSAQFRQELSASNRLRTDISYGEGERQSLDLFQPEGASRGLVVLVHGGYWLRFDKSDWSFLAEGCLRQGWSVAIPGYRLAPQASLTQIRRDINAAVHCAAEQVPGPVRLAGHSAGGHLLARLLCDDLTLSKELVVRLAHVVPISGIFDLRPLLANHMNASLQLDLAEATAESPVMHKPLKQVPVTLWVGAEERPEFLRQTRLLCEKWSVMVDRISACYEPDKNHFSVIDSLSQADSALTRRLLGID